MLMNKRIFTSAAVVLALAFSASYAQDIHFSQWYNTPLNLNPSLAGVSKDVQIIANYRDQWRAVASPYKTFQISADVRYSKKKWKKGALGLGINIYQDNAGDANLATTQGNLSIAYHVRTGDNSSFVGGIQAGGV